MQGVYKSKYWKNTLKLIHESFKLSEDQTHLRPLYFVNSAPVKNVHWNNDCNRAERIIYLQRQKQRSAYLHAECEISTVLQGFEVRQALEYAETLIVYTAVLVEERFATAIIIGKDTDLLILLTWKGDI